MRENSCGCIFCEYYVCILCVGGSNKAVCDGLCARACLSLGIREIMMSWFLVRDHSVWRLHFGIWRSRINTSISALHLSFCIFYPLYCSLYLTVLVVVNPVESHNHVRRPVHLNIGLSDLSSHSFIQIYLFVICSSPELFCCDGSHFFVWLYDCPPSFSRWKCEEVSKNRSFCSKTQCRLQSKFLPGNSILYWQIAWYITQV